ncbi:unnamed protein product [Arctogadus glacialis]
MLVFPPQIARGQLLEDSGDEWEYQHQPRLRGYSLDCRIRPDGIDHDDSFPLHSIGQRHSAPQASSGSPLTRSTEDLREALTLGTMLQPSEKIRSEDWAPSADRLLPPGSAPVAAEQTLDIASSVNRPGMFHFWPDRQSLQVSSRPRPSRDPHPHPHPHPNTAGDTELGSRLEVLQSQLNRLETRVAADITVILQILQGPPATPVPPAYSIVSSKGSPLPSGASTRLRHPSTGAPSPSPLVPDPSTGVFSTGAPSPNTAPPSPSGPHTGVPTPSAPLRGSITSLLLPLAPLLLPLAPLLLPLAPLLLPLAPLLLPLAPLLLPLAPLLLPLAPLLLPLAPLLLPLDPLLLPLAPLLLPLAPLLLPLAPLLLPLAPLLLPLAPLLLPLAPLLLPLDPLLLPLAPLLAPPSPATGVSRPSSRPLAPLLAPLSPVLWSLAPQVGFLTPSSSHMVDPWLPTMYTISPVLAERPPSSAKNQIPTKSIKQISENPGNQP